jgi:hypothetical protein
MLHHLIYVSAARELLGDAELDGILASSARNNAAHGITGMLLYASGSFMQVLEGEEADVERTYARILPDRRHQSPFVIERGPIPARSFGSWSMGFRRLGPRDAALHPQYAPLFAGGFDAAKIGARPGIALDLLRQFGRNQRD